MPLVDATLSTALQNIENAAYQAALDGNPWTIKKYCDEKAAALDAQTKTATVNSTVSVTSVSGVTTGAGISGPGAGTAVGTIS